MKVLTTWKVTNASNMSDISTLKMHERINYELVWTIKMCKTLSMKETTRECMKISKCINSEMCEHCTKRGNKNFKK